MTPAEGIRLIEAGCSRAIIDASTGRRADTDWTLFLRKSVEASHTTMRRANWKFWGSFLVKTTGLIRSVIALVKQRIRV